MGLMQRAARMAARQASDLMCYVPVFCFAMYGSQVSLIKCASLPASGRERIEEEDLYAAMENKAIE